MPKSSLPHSMLSFFTSSERAEAIEGDLMEERLTRGNLWFQIQLIRTTFALFLQAFMQAPLRTVALSTATLGLIFVVGSISTDILRQIWFSYTPDPSFMALISIITTFITSFLLGMGLLRMSPAHGIPAVIATAPLLLLAIVIAQLPFRTATFQQQFDDGLGFQFAMLVEVFLIVMSMLLYALNFLVPLFLGSMVTRRRFLRQSI